MEIFNRPAEAKLVQSASKLKEQRTQVYCIHFGLSGLGNSKTKTDLSILANIIKEGIKELEGGIYLCHDFDLFVILKTSDNKIIQQIISNVRFYYADDPLACGIEKDNIKEFAIIYDVAKNYEDFFFACNRKLVAYNELKKSLKNQPNETLIQDTENINMVMLKSALLDRASRDKICILIVEDQAFSRQLLKASLDKNYLTLVAKDAVQGLDAYTSNAPDMVFLDIELPDQDGYYVLRNMLSADPSAFVIMTTANNTEKDVRKSITEGARGYIIKPFTKQKIDQYINVYLAKFKK
jgi:two-component system chemotaxis response regulator CheY